MKSGSDFLAGGGELGALMRQYDWAATPLGSPHAWPRSLKTAVRIMLTSRQPIWLGWGPELTYLYNDPYKSIIGGKHPRALGQPFREVWSEIWDVVGPMADTVMARDEGTYVEAQLLIMERHGYQEETYYTFSYSPVPNDDGGPGGLICANTDDTRRVIGERQLATVGEVAAAVASARSRREACAFGMDVLAASSRDIPFALIYLEEDDGFSLAASSAGSEALHDVARWPWRRVMAANEQELVALGEPGLNVPCGAWSRPPHQAAVLPIAGSDQSGATGVLVVGLNPFRQFDDSYRNFLELAARQLAAGITNAEAYAEERRRAEGLAELDRAKTAFFSNVSHEFRTPLTLMMGPLEDILGHVGQLPAADRARLEVAYRNSARLLKLVNTLLDFSRIESGRMRAAYEPVDLTSLTTELAAVFRSAVERAGLSLTVDLAPVDAPAYVDRDLWEKVVFNLLSNAFKFTFEGGITVGLQQRGGRALLSVRDTGTGIPEGDLPHVFERFHRVQGARGRTFEGSGIGLALVQEVVRLHGGEVRVDSQVGRGSTFTVELPLGRAHLPDDRIAAASSADASAAHGRVYVDELASQPADEVPIQTPRGADGAGEQGTRARIVLADDNADMRSYLTRLLAAEYDVEAVNDGREALAAARRQRPELVVTDVMMPHMDGFGLLDALRADEHLRSVPVIILSARAGEEANIEGIRAGADDYLVKPFGARELLARVAGRLELSRLQARVEAQRTSLASLFAQTPVPTAVLRGPDLIFAMANDAYRAVVGGREVVGRRLVDALPEMKGQALEESLREVLASGQPRVGHETPLRLERNGAMTDAFFTFIYAPLRDAQGGIDGVILICHDVTEQVRAREAVRDADRRKDEFLATLSHELRNPLAPLRNSLHLLRMHAGPDGGVADGTARIYEIMTRQVDHLVRLVDDLMEVSRISRGTLELRRERIDLGTIVRNALESCAPLIEAAGHRLRVSLPQEPVWVDGDPIRLGQIIANLLNNAARYTDAGGNIWVDASADRGHGIITVRDDGSGISAATLPRIFDMFSRGERARDRSQQGLGIGLALARSLAEMHGGGVTARSDGPGKGSEFTVRLPLAGAPHPASAAAPRAPERIGPLRILVVDDNRDAADSLGLILRAMGSDVRVEHSGAAALEAMRTYRPSVVLLDIGMPTMDGYEVARRVRAGSQSRLVRIIALTGWGQEEDRRRAREAGFDYHLVKPVDIDALQALLASIERERKATAAASVSAGEPTA